MHVRVESVIEETPRVMQVRGLFDLAAEETSAVEWDIDVDLTAKSWNIGLVTGPSGCGKSTLARHLLPPGRAVWLENLPPWPDRQSVVEGFRESLSVKEVTELLGAVGFSSPPAWLRPYAALSTGQRFRCDLARLLSQGGTGGEHPPQLAGVPTMPLVFDEFTSVVDRTVAKIGSAAVAKAVRARKLKFVAVTCHDDVADWLQPDWTLNPGSGQFAWRSLRRRPRIHLEVSRCSNAVWPLFAPHHYLSHSLAAGSWCFLATWEQGGTGGEHPPQAGRPVCFSSWLPFVGAGPPSRREHRTVVLPDFQGVGIGMAVSALIVSMWKALGFVARSTTTHPAFKAARQRSKDWRLVREPSLASGKESGRYRNLGHASMRMTTGWEYVGPALPTVQARALLGAGGYGG